MMRRLRPILAAAVLVVARLVSGADAGEAAAVPADRVIASYSGEGAVDALAAGYGYVAWVVTARDRRSSVVRWRSPDGRLGSVHVRHRLVRALEVVRGPVPGDVAVIGQRCKPDGPDDVRGCRPIQFGVSGAQPIPAWASPLITARRQGAAAAVEDGRLLRVGHVERPGVATPADPHPRRRDVCAATLEAAGLVTPFPDIPECFGASDVVLRGDIAVAYGPAERGCNCDTWGLWAIDVTHPERGWKDVGTHGEGRAASAGVISWAPSRDGVITLQGGTGYDADRDRSYSFIPSLQRSIVTGVLEGASLSEPEVLVRGDSLVGYSAIAGTGAELVALARERTRGRHDRRITRTLVVRVPAGPAAEERSPQLVTDP